MSEMKIVLFKSSKIRVDENGLVCLNDIHAAAGFSKNQKPSDWIALPSPKKEIVSMLRRITGKSGNWSKDEIKSVHYTKVGASGGTWVHENLALGYAAYLSSELAVEIREVFLRYKRNDATLADEILEKATPAENEWAAVRALGRVKRNEFTQSLQDHGVEGYGYAQCTDAVYKEVLGNPAKKLKTDRGLTKSDNLRNSMSTDELVSVMFAESLSRRRIEVERPHGNAPCIAATRKSANTVKKALEAERLDSKPSLL